MRLGLFTGQKVILPQAIDEMQKMFAHWLHSLFQVVVSTPRRRIAPELIGGIENLECRFLLSAVKSGGREIAAESPMGKNVAEKAAHPKKGIPDNLPDMTGMWDIYTHLDGGIDVHGVLDLTQKGKKVTGTLKNDFQPIGKFQAKLKPGLPENSPRAADSPATGKGKADNKSVDSDTVPIYFVIAAGLLDGYFKSHQFGNALFNGTRR